MDKYMNNHEIDQLKSINDLSGMKFFVPKFQRGYRWKSEQIIDLIDDLCEFFGSQSEKNCAQKNDMEYYCMQPVVVAKRSQASDEYVLIDGQQRLTSFFLMIKVINEHGDLKNNQSLYTLSYETRPNSAEFLENIHKIYNNLNTSLSKDKHNASENIDYEHFINTYGKFKDNYERIKNFNFNKIKVIFYEVEIHTDNTQQTSELEYIKIFNRLNSGKIPLSNAELIKALLCKSDNFYNLHEQLSCAQNIENFEIQLQNEKLWHFLSNEAYEKRLGIANRYDRLNLLYEILCLKYETQDNNVYFQAKSHNKDEYHSFRIISKKFNNNQPSYHDKNSSNLASIHDAVQTILSDLKQLFYALKSWYEEDEYYHLIGFCIATKIASIAQIYMIFNSNNKIDFKNILKNRIKAYFNFEKADNFEQYLSNFIEKHYNYDRNHKTRDLLLLFNIASIHKSSSRFDFSAYKRENWSLEHINPQSNRRLDKDDVKEILENFNITTTPDLNRRIETIQTVEQITVFLREQNLWNFDDYMGDLDSISNLTLLQVGNNASLSNKLFYQKLNTIKRQLDGFVPIGTKNVFLKFYTTHNVTQNLLYWSYQDADEYYKNMCHEIAHYLNDNSNNK